MLYYCTTLKNSSKFKRFIQTYLQRRKLSKAVLKSKTKWESVVGLEVHAQISSMSKLFSGASTEFANPVNTNVSLFDAAIPGTLPVLNKRCVEAGVLTALALSCNVNAISTFDRKHYFYADLPAGYQITQQTSPLAQNGLLRFEVYTPGIHKIPYTKTANIKQLQLEQDSGKSLHDEELGRSLVDLNRAGIPLMELVFEPDLTDGEEAAALVKELIMILQRLRTCSCKMEEGALRVDANVSVNKSGDPFGVRSEIKNIGSIRGVALAVKYEIQRQIKELEAGGSIINETRSWDAQRKITVPMRDKEVVQDYRYMPEPNLPPLHLNVAGLEDPFSSQFIDVQKLKKKLPELPEETREKLRIEYNLPSEQSIIIVQDDMLLSLFNKISKKIDRNPNLIANVLINELLTSVNKNKLELRNINISADYLGEIVDLLQLQTINLVTARKIIDIIMLGNNNNPTNIMKENNWSQINDVEEIRELCKSIIENESKLVKQYLAGKNKVFSAFLGIAATTSNQRANMEKTSLILKELLSKQAKK